MRFPLFMQERMQGEKAVRPIRGKQSGFAWEQFDLAVSWQSVGKMTMIFQRGINSVFDSFT